MENGGICVGGKEGGEKREGREEKKQKMRGGEGEGIRGK